MTPSHTYRTSVSIAARRIHIALLLACCIARTSLATESPLEVIHLQYRPADEMVNLVRPFLGPDDVIASSGTQLILRTAPERLAQIRRMIGELDRAPRQLEITVRRSQSDDMESSGASISGKISDKHESHAQARIYSTESRSVTVPVQRIRVLEGRPAQIESGQAVPMAKQQIITGLGGTIVTNTIDYRDTTTGFIVIPRLSGKDAVVLEIHPHSAIPSPQGGGKLEVQRAHTELRTRLGEWVELGSNETTARHDDTSIVRRTQSRDTQLHRIWLRVDEVQP